MKKKNLVLLCVSVLCFLLGTFEGVDVKAAEAQADYVSMEERNGCIWKVTGGIIM